MLYRYSLTIPANTPVTAPTTAIAPLEAGTLQYVSVSFPPGCAGLAHVAVLRHEHQIIPANPNEYLAWDDLTIIWPESFPIDEVPFSLKLSGWNEDDTYQHTITFRFDVIATQTNRLARVRYKLFGVSQ